MRDQTHDEIRSLLPAYALGAVSAEELRTIRDHILGCDECMAEADSYGVAADGLALSVEETALPPGFADAVLAKVAHPQPAPARPAWNRWLAALAATSVLVIAALTAALFDVRDDLDRQQRALAQILRDDSGMTLAGVEGAAARMVPTPDGGLFAAAGLEEAPEGRTYQLWVIDDDGPHDAGTFEVDDGSVLLEVDRSLGTAEAVAVTIEPDGGSAQPTSEPILSSSDAA